MSVKNWLCLSIVWTAFLFSPAEYQDVWTAENKWTSNNELKVGFKKIRKEIKITNQVVEDFLHEAMIMRKFNHPNILKLIGVSTHNDKPCVILPLMNHGDLKGYLKNNISVSIFLSLIHFYNILLWRKISMNIIILLVSEISRYDRICSWHC